MCAKAPGVALQERDVSTVVQGPSTSIGALVGASPRGKIGGRFLSTTTKKFRNQYCLDGKAELGNNFHYSALAFLKEAQSLYCVRVVNGALYSGVVIDDEAASNFNRAFPVGVADPDLYPLTADDVFAIASANPGAWANRVGIRITNVDAAEYTFTIEVYWQDADSGVYSLVEEWDVSRVTDKKDGYGRAMYLEEVINDNSEYIHVVDNTAVTATVLPEAEATTLALAGGTNGIAPTASQIATAWTTYFANINAVEVSILIAGGQTDPTVVTAMIDSVAAARQDAVAVLDVPAAENTVAKAVVWRDTLSISNPSYGALYYPWIKDTDEDNDRLVEVPPSGYVAGVYAKTDREANFWSAPYGLNRGVLSVIGVVQELDEGEMDVLYTAQINPIPFFPGEGVTVWGQRTLQAKLSTLAGMHARRLLNYCETAVKGTARYWVGEPNTDFTRTQVKQTLDAFFEPLIAQDAFYDVVVQCDEGNNTPAVIDANELRVSIYVQVVRIADRIPITVIITRTGVSLEELASGAVIA